MLALYNDLSREKEEFQSIEKDKVKFYVCGPTVYNYFHIGNARPFVMFDIFRRYLEYLGYEVTYVQNFTDIDDKMINRANELGITVDELAEQFITAYYEDTDALGIKRATFNPRATREIDEIIKIIAKLISKDHAYEVEGDVYFSVASFPEYGKLSKQSLEELQSGARVDVDDRKRNPIDFALWKASKPGEPSWSSPWGEGRPGWHIECSAMATKYLGESIDIHGGGSDLIFPHHENEIAQSEAACGCMFVRYWLHNAYLMIDMEKMSKSSGNFKTVRDICKKYNPLVLRYFLLSAHYRSPINFSTEALEQSQSALERIKNSYEDLKFALSKCDTEVLDATLRGALADTREGFTESMNDDFNTAGALGYIFNLVRAVNVHLTDQEQPDKEGLEAALAFFNDVNAILGILAEKTNCDGENSEIEALIAERNEARKTKNFARSDEIRELFAKRGIILEDTPQGTRWKKSI